MLMLYPLEDIEEVLKEISREPSWFGVHLGEPTQSTMSQHELFNIRPVRGYVEAKLQKSPHNLHLPAFMLFCGPSHTA
jgi:hypothetical protein